MVEIRAEVARLNENRAVTSWWFDYATGEVVRCADGRRWEPREVPELRLSAEQLRPVDLPTVDAWVLAQPEKE